MWQNKTMEQYLRAFVNNEEDHRAELHPKEEFVYNNLVYASTRITPFWAMYHWNTEMQFNAPKASNLKSEHQADATLRGLGETHWTLRENILEAQQCHTIYAGGTDIMFDFEGKVWLSSKHFQTTRQSKSSTVNARDNTL
jgi:hypothetical protein